MKKIYSLKSQTVSDIAIQEYGNVDTIFKILEDNPQLAGKNEFPDGYIVDENADFDISHAIIEGTEINITENYILEKPDVTKEIETVIS